MVDVPPFDLDPLHERAAVTVKMPFSVVVLDHVKRMKVSLAIWTRLDLVRPCLYSVSTLRVAKKTDISDDLADLG
jgi:adenylate cyclase